MRHLEEDFSREKAAFLWNMSSLVGEALAFQQVLLLAVVEIVFDTNILVTTTKTDSDRVARLLGFLVFAVLVWVEMLVEFGVEHPLEVVAMYARPRRTEGLHRREE